MKLIFLLGAGASVEAGIPTMVDFTARFRVSLAGHDAGKALTRLYRKIERYWRRDPRRPRPFDLEVLFQILFHINRVSDSHQLLRRDSRLPTSSRISELLEYELRLFILNTCRQVDAKRVGYLAPLLAFKSVAGSIDIASLNYDLCIETLCQATGVSFTDGFMGRRATWHRSRLISSYRGAVLKLMKLHGSVAWYRAGGGTFRRLETDEEYLTGGSRRAARPLVPERAMLYPGLNKAILEEPFATLFDVFNKKLQAADLCIVAGYSFMDQHICGAVARALRVNTTLQVVIIDPSAQVVKARLVASAPGTEDRIHIIWKKRKGYFGNALRRGWLLKQVRNLCRRKTQQPKSNILTALALGNRGAQVVSRLREPLSGIASAEGGDALYVAGAESGALYRVSLPRWQVFRLPVNVRRPRGLYVDSTSTTLYFVENSYRAVPHESIPLWLRDLEGYGRVWRVDLRTNKIEPVTWASRVPSDPSEVPPTGVLSWPSGLVEDRSDRCLFVTEARRLVKLDLATGSSRGIIRPPLAFNVSSVSWMGPRRLLILDHGVVDDYGTGRLMSVDLHTKRMKTLAQLGPFAWCARYHRRLRSVFITTRSVGDTGEVLRVSIPVGKVDSFTYVPSKPSELAVIPSRELIVITTRDGLFAASTS